MYGVLPSLLFGRGYLSEMVRGNPNNSSALGLFISWHGQFYGVNMNKRQPIRTSCFHAVSQLIRALLIFSHAVQLWQGILYLWRVLGDINLPYTWDESHFLLQCLIYTLPSWLVYWSLIASTLRKLFVIITRWMCYSFGVLQLLWPWLPVWQMINYMGTPVIRNCQSSLSWLGSQFVLWSNSLP